MQRDWPARTGGVTVRGAMWIALFTLLARTATAQAPSAASGASRGASPMAGDSIFVYGPGGPLPAMTEAAAAFERRSGTVVRVTGGPAPMWVAEARRKADVIFSGAEHMMTDFVTQLRDTAAAADDNGGRIDESSIVPLYLRPAAILVRPGNPKHVRRFEDLLRPGIKVLVVQGAGQTGLWEDVAGRTGDIAVVRAFRRNIGGVAANSGAAKQTWTGDSTYDAWLIWNVWQVANLKIADLVALAEPWRVYRDAGVALTAKGRVREPARDFVAFLQSAAGARIFARWGWVTKSTATRR